MHFGYWYTSDIRWGEHKVDFPDTWLPGLYTTSDEVWPPGTPRPWAPLQASAIRHAAEAGKYLLLNLYMGMSRRVPTPKTVAQAKPYWDQVIGLDLADEPDWTKEEVIENVAGVRRTMESKGVEVKPVGVTLEYREQVFTEAKRYINAGIDFVCLEAYLDPPGIVDPAQAATKLRESLWKQIAMFPESIDIVLILQAYTRNGAWTAGLASLEEMQRATFAVGAELGDRCLALTAFAYARPTGVLDNPSLKQVHKQLVARYGGV